MKLRAGIVLVLVSVLTPLGAIAEPLAQGDDESKASELLADAERDYENGRYAAARRAYERLAKKYPETEAGEVGVERSQPSAFLGATEIVDNGPSANRLDIVLMGDGYTLEHQDAFDELAEDVPFLFERQETFREYLSYLNFHRANLVSKDDNVDGFGREEDTALGAYTTGTVQGHVAVDTSAVRRTLAKVPGQDGLAIVFVRVGILGTGSPGIATIGGRSAVTVIHEWGHAFARLGDEYSTHTHDRGYVPVLANVSDTDDPERVPWAHWIEAKAPGVGVYEGANGRVRGAWKPTASSCVMLDGEFFCPPCREALVLRIYSIVDPIDSTNYPPVPFDHPASLEITDAFEFEVNVLRPARHNLEVSWWIFPEREAPREPSGYDERYATSSGGRPVGRTGDRRDRGALWDISAKPNKFSHVNKTGVHRFRVKARDLEPGRYRVVCRARDATRFRGEKLPWVLKDDLDLLESERAWWILVPGEEDE